VSHNKVISRCCKPLPGENVAAAIGGALIEGRRLSLRRRDQVPGGLRILPTCRQRCYRSTLSERDSSLPVPAETGLHSSPSARLAIAKNAQVRGAGPLANRTQCRYGFGRIHGPRHACTFCSSGPQQRRQPVKIKQWPTLLSKGQGQTKCALRLPLTRVWGWNRGALDQRDLESVLRKAYM
jgi:hypothetical protein